jgi:hypothetical protein
MGLEGDLKALGFKLSRPLSQDRYDVAYRVEGMTDANLMRGQELIRSFGVLEELQLNGYTNVRVDLWKLHITRGWPETAYLAIQAGDYFEAVKLRVSYINHLLVPFEKMSEGPLEQDLRRLLQRMHFPDLHQSVKEDLGQYFWDFTLNQNLWKLPHFTQSQIHCICMGFANAQKRALVPNCGR